MSTNRIIIFGLSFPLLLFSFCNIYAQQNQPIDGGGSGGIEGIGLSDPKLKIDNSIRT